MRILVNGASKTVRELLPIYGAELGAMITPFTGNAPTSIAALGIPWVCDNGCFPQRGKRFGFDAFAFTRMIDRVQGLPGLQWVTVPDYVERREDGNVYGDAAKTRAMFDDWAPRMEARGLPLAYVLQDGVTASEIPWDRIVCVFVGGSDEFKLGRPAPWLEGQATVKELCAEAKARGKTVHVGRVNSLKRIRYSYLECQADTVDGTATSMFPRIKIPFFADGLRRLMAEHPRTPPAAPAARVIPFLPKHAKLTREEAPAMAKKKKVGRPAKPKGEKAVKVSISVPPELVAYAERHFEGSVTALVHDLWARAGAGRKRTG